MLQQMNKFSYDQHNLIQPTRPQFKIILVAA